MADTEVRHELAIPGIGALVNLEDPREVGIALADIRSLEDDLRDMKRDLTAALIRYSETVGGKTFHLEGLDVVLTEKKPVTWDVEALEAKLRRAGLPEDRIDALIKVVVTRTVNANVAKQIAGANPKYARIVKACRSEGLSSTSATVTVL